MMIFNDDIWSDDEDGDDDDDLKILLNIETSFYFDLSILKV